jgi:hypothetical protein
MKYGKQRMIANRFQFEESGTAYGRIKIKTRG